MPTFNGLGMSLGNLPRLSPAKSRSISPENPTGEPGKGGRATEGTGARPARDLGPGWKVSPSVEIAPGEDFVLADIAGSGALQHIWVANLPNVRLRDLILRMYWDNQKLPSVEVPLGDFFCCGWEEYAQVSSLAVCVNPGKALNCYWLMPYRRRARLTLENRSIETATVYYQVNYTETEVDENCAWFHARFRRVNPLPYKEDFVILDGVTGQGQYVGTYMAWGVNSNGWWGEGEVKFFLDGDSDYPTICGTGTEDYFCGAFNFDPGSADPARPKAYTEYTTPYAGLPQVIRPDGCYRSQQRFGMYRWHVTDPVRFERDLRVTVQALGWHPGAVENRRYRPLQDDIAAVAFWYQTLPAPAFPDLPPRDYLAV